MLVTVPIGSVPYGSAPPSLTPGFFPELDSSQKLQGRNLLVVEDAEDIWEFLSYFLQQHGAQVVTASCGQDALACLDAQTFDVVLMDLQMPILDGMETTIAMRRRGFKGVIMAVTAHALQGEREQCQSAGFEEFLSKPIQLPQVLNLIEHRLRLQNAPSIPINSRHDL